LQFLSRICWLDAWAKLTCSRSIPIIPIKYDLNNRKLLSEKSVKFPEDMNLDNIECHQVKFKEDQVFQSIWYAEDGGSTYYYYFAILIEIKGIGQITKIFTSQGNFLLQLVFSNRMI